MSNAAVPLDTATAYFRFIYLEKSLSKSFTKDPSEDIQLVLRHFFTFILMVV